MTSPILAEAFARGAKALPEAEGKALLAAYGLPVPSTKVVTDPARVADELAGASGPFAVKVVSPDLLHKSDAGGVALGLQDADAVAAAIAEMAARPAIRSARVDGWLVEEMAPKGREMVIGALTDPQFGPILMVGIGGIFVEVLQDVSFRLCPITEADARAMLAELKGHALLEGVRGEAAVDQDALVDAMLRIGGEDGLMMREGAAIAELDINPLIVGERGAMAVDARVILQADAAAERPPHEPADLAPLFEPKTVAVLGASTKETAIANTFIRRMKDFGYAGEIYPIHPKADEIEGLTAYTDLASTPKPVDYAYVAIGAGRIPDALAAAKGNCRIAQVISSGFGEVEEGKALQEELVEKARGAGIRVLGPNCLGSYSPRGGLTFPVGAPKEVGNIGVVAQSGGLSTDIIKRGQSRGLRFSGLVTVGNSCDLGPVDLLEFYLADPVTKAIGLYIEDIKDGRAFFDLLRSARATKPVVILKGGRSSLGRLAAASHTGALAGDDRAWAALEAQTPVVSVPHVNAFLDTLLALQCLTPRAGRPTEEVVLFGNGGGSSVLGTDAFADAGLRVSPFGPAAREPLEALGLPPGTSVANPVDTPVRTLQEKEGWVAGEILDLIYAHARPDAVALHLNLAAFVGRGDVDPIGNLMTVVESIQEKYPGQAHVTLALRSDESAELEAKRRDYAERAIAAGVPVFSEIAPMADALAAVAHLERRLDARG
ncbi:acetate--CoA ligase family protein [Rhodovulum sp. 12E13]|uniref:acetate--CoA ligase family protein n=1 Tax=Rhodovulum sp. 12E13 TaxID=2203891 RepID=UPI0018F659C4|nr:acetate--CoA ligase family protein [Rhodovulum sp. 12E13]